jgi:hypothetical protein
MKYEVLGHRTLNTAAIVQALSTCSSISLSVGNRWKLECALEDTEYGAPVEKHTVCETIQFLMKNTNNYVTHKWSSFEGINNFSQQYRPFIRVQQPLFTQITA